MSCQVTRNSKFIDALIESGVVPKHTVDFSIECKIDSPITVTATYYPESEKIEAVTDPYLRKLLRGTK